MSEVITRDEWLQALEADRVDQHPDALTREQLEELWGVGATAVRVRLRRWKAEGKVQSVIRKTLDTSGRSISIPAYILVKEKKA